MLQRLALHLDEGLLPGGMHEFQNEFTPVNGLEMKIIIVLTGERLGGDFEAENFPRNANGFRFGDRLGHALFGNHAGNLIRKGWTASILAGFNISEERNTKQALVTFLRARIEPRRARSRSKAGSWPESRQIRCGDCCLPRFSVLYRRCWHGSSSASNCATRRGSGTCSRMERKVGEALSARRRSSRFRSTSCL